LAEDASESRDFERRIAAREVGTVGRQMRSAWPLTLLQVDNVVLQVMTAWRPLANEGVCSVKNLQTTVALIQQTH
jgi:hypothetical protein